MSSSDLYSVSPSSTKVNFQTDSPIEVNFKLDSSILIDPRPIYTPPQISKTRQWFMLSLFCIGQFMDAFLSCALFPAQPFIEKDLGVQPNEITWTFSAYGATFAGFLLVSGRISDIFNSKWAFVAGTQLVALFSLGCGFVQDKVGLFILRALCGVGAALTVPAALALIVEWFPDAKMQNMAIALFGMCGAIGSVLGILIAGLFIQFVNWRWIFYFACILVGPLGLIGIFLIPAGAPKPSRGWRGLDLGGVFLITSATILFVYAITSGSADGWGTVNVIVPLVISFVTGAAYFYLQTRLGSDKASLPTEIWRYRNVAILVALTLFPLGWWNALFLELYPRFEDVYHWSPVMSSVRMLFIGVFATIVGGFSAKLVQYVDPKWTILGAFLLDFAATILLPFFDRESRYWSFFVPASIMGTIASMVIYTNANIAIFRNTPPEIAGTIGAVFNAAFQLGSAVELAIVTSIDTSISDPADPTSYKPIAAGFWFILAFLVVEAIAVAIFYKTMPKAKKADIERNAMEMAKRHDEERKRASIYETMPPLPPIPVVLSKEEDPETEKRRFR